LLVSAAGAEMRMRGTFVMTENLVASMELRVVNSEVLSEKSLMSLLRSVVLGSLFERAVREVVQVSLW
jgi:hypothetical protein